MRKENTRKENKNWWTE